jgi:hypothetical protein
MAQLGAPSGGTELAQATPEQAVSCDESLRRMMWSGGSRQLAGRFRLLVSSRWIARASIAATVVWLLVALLGFAAHTNGFYPLREWLTFLWARAWLGALVLHLASLAAGAKVLALLRAPIGRTLDRYVLAHAVGVLVFALGIYVAGLLGLLTRWFFFAWPTLLLLGGGRTLIADFKRIAKHLRSLGPKCALPQSPTHALSVLLIVGGVLLFYLRVVTPSSISFDARWYHLPIAESYAAAGRIRPFPEGWYLGAYPHLASLLYTWAFLAPGELSEHLSLTSHVEFVLRVATVVGISALAARLVPGPRLRHGGAAFFLFPCIFHPAGALNGGADDVLAYWAAPLGLALLRYLASSDWRNGVLLGALIGAAGLTKYQAIYALAAIALVLGVDLALRRRFRLLLVTGAVALVVASPHWLKNWIAYGDPLYPNLHRWLPVHPFFPGAGAWLERYYLLPGPPLSATEKLRASLEFSFFPHGWAGIPTGRPLFGSLFTLLVPLAFWVRRRREILLLVACTHVGLVVWAFTVRDDRFLQAIVPWMAACTAAILAALWRTQRPMVRLGTAVLVAFQLVWGADVHFLRPYLLRELSDHVAAGDERNFARQPYPGTELQVIGRKLNDPRAKLVSHDFYQTVGVGTQLLHDNPAWQGAIDYLALDTPERTFKKWRELGATHVLWPSQKEARAPDDLARDAVLARAVAAFTRSPFTVAGYKVAQLVRGPARDPERDRTRIAWLGCGSERALGIYTPEGLALGNVEHPLTSVELASDPSTALAKANAVWTRASCAEAVSASSVLSGQFEEVLRSGEITLVVRRPR